MGFNHLNVFTPRRVTLDYRSPAICVAMFSGSGEVAISLQPIEESMVAGLLWTWLGDFGRLSWGAYPGALCYSIYKLVDEEDPFSEYVIVAECVTDAFLSTLAPGTYKVEAITPNGTTSFSEPIVGEDEDEPPPGPTPCPQFGPALPPHFLVENEEIVVPIIVDGTTGSSDTANIPTPGRYVLQYQSGVINENCGLFLSEGVTSLHFEDDAAMLIPFYDPLTQLTQTATVNYGCSWLFFQPQPCNAAADIAAARPDGLLAMLDYTPIGFANPEINIHGLPAGGCGAGTGACSHVFKRTHTFLPQPALVNVTGHPNGDHILALTTYHATGIQYTGASQITINVPGAWTLNYDGGIWSGTKSYGSGPTGNYAKSSGTGPDCLVVY
jgi:hypothetical protein